MPSGYPRMVADDKPRIQYLELKVNTFHHWTSKQNYFFKKYLKPVLFWLLEDTSERSLEKQMEAFSHLFFVAMPNIAFLEKN